MTKKALDANEIIILRQLTLKVSTFGPPQYRAMQVNGKHL